MAREFSASVTTGTGERLPYTLAVHHGEGENPHAHLMFSERANDGIARSAEQWFRRRGRPKVSVGRGFLEAEARRNDRHPATLGPPHRVAGSALSHGYRGARAFALAAAHRAVETAPR